MIVSFNQWCCVFWLMDYWILAFKQIWGLCYGYYATFMRKSWDFFIFLTQLTSFNFGQSNFLIFDLFLDFQKSISFSCYCWLLKSTFSSVFCSSFSIAHTFNSEFIPKLRLYFNDKAYHKHYYWPFFEWGGVSPLIIEAWKYFLSLFLPESLISVVKPYLMCAYSAQSVHCKIILYQCGFWLRVVNLFLDWMCIILVLSLIFLCKFVSSFRHFGVCGRQYFWGRTNFTFIFNCENFVFCESIQLV